MNESPPSPAASVAAPPDNARWFVDEVHVHDAQLKAYLRGSFPSIRDVDDVVQESYLRVWRRQVERPITDVPGTVKASVRGFLFRVAKRLALDLLRRERVSPIDPASGSLWTEAAADAPDAAEVACARQEIELLLEAIETLPRRCREVLVLRKIEGLSQKEIAARLGLSEETVQVQARRGLRRCNAHLRRRGVARCSS